MKIALIDDDEGYQKIFEDIISNHEQYCVDYFMSNEDFRGADPSIYDLIIVDHTLPGDFNGIDIIKALKKNNLTDAKFILISTEKNVYSQCNKTSNDVRMKINSEGKYMFDELLKSMDRLTENSETMKIARKLFL